MSEQQFADFEVPDLNLEEVTPWDGEQAPLVDPGEHQLTVIDISSEAGKKAPYFKFTFEVATEGPFKGMKVYNNYSLSKEAIGRLKQLALACGAPLQGFIASNYLGVTIEATIYHSESAGGVDANGVPREPKTFANVKNERAISAPATTKTADKPPVMNKPAAATTKPAGNNAARRA